MGAGNKVSANDKLSDWVLVPREPTPKMILAGYEADKEYSYRQLGPECGIHSADAYEHYKAMLAAAPAPAVVIDTNLAFLKDPENVLSLMLKGIIAVPTIRSMVKLRGEVLNGEDALQARIAELQEQLATQGDSFLNNGTRIEWEDNIGNWHTGTITGYNSATYNADLDDGTQAEGYARGRFREIATQQGDG